MLKIQKKQKQCKVRISQWNGFTSQEWDNSLITLQNGLSPKKHGFNEKPEIKENQQQN